MTDASGAVTAVTAVYAAAVTADAADVALAASVAEAAATAVVADASALAAPASPWPGCWLVRLGVDGATDPMRLLLLPLFAVAPPAGMSGSARVPHCKGLSSVSQTTSGGGVEVVCDTAAPSAARSLPPVPVPWQAWKKGVLLGTAQ